RMKQEKAILVEVIINGEKKSLDELASLAHTAGAKVVGSITQNRDKPDQRTYIGEGKLKELHALVAKEDANLVIFDNELKPSETRNLQSELGVKVIDRTGLILDIFAQHANSREGKLQVELAQLDYTLTHLTGKGIELSRLGGGIGTRGPGETKLEMDRRRIRKTISQLKKELESIRAHRSTRRQARKASLIPVAAIVGYTNAGKSTLLNILTEAGVLVQDKLFATLDPTTRKVKLPNGWELLLTDTVGFIQKLPHGLVESFKATLEEITEADILLHVVDSTSPDLEDHISAVYNILEDLKAISKPIITIFNKIDGLKKKLPRKLIKKYAPAVEMSALKKENVDKLLESTVKYLKENMVTEVFRIPQSKGSLISHLYDHGNVLSREYEGNYCDMKVEIDRITAERLGSFIKRD
ncbi:GTPase HflX, partial [Candidatus Margulisiibacteriota bacterium]